MIAASMMLGRPTIPHHNRFQPPFHPHLISRVVDAAIEMAEHGIRFISCQFINRFGKGSIHKQGFIARHWMFSQNRVVGGFFPIDRLGKLGREVILAVLSISSPFYIDPNKTLIIAPSMPLSVALHGDPFALPASP